MAPRAHPFVVAALPARFLLDLAPLSTPLGTLPQLGSALILAGLAALVLARWRQAAEHPWRWPLALVSAAVLVAALRSDTPLDAVRYGLHAVGPILWLLAVHVAGPDEPPRVWFAAASVPVALSLGALALGQPADHVLHGFARLHGAYGNLHGHSSAMALFAGVGLATALLVPDRRSPWLVSGVLGALLALGATWVRTGWIFAALVVIAAGLASGRVRGVVVLGIGLLGASAVGTVRQRWSDAGAILTGVPPEGGWGALGSWRGRIWTDSFARWAEGPASDVWLGRGLGGHFGLHKHLDPHSDWLAALFQLGPLGAAAVAVAVVIALRDLAARRADPWGAIALGALVACVVTATFGNDVVVRPTVTWSCAALVGIGLARRPPL